MNRQYRIPHMVQRTWILLAHRSGARIYKNPGKTNEFNLVHTFDFPEGRRQNHEIDTDAKGSRYSSTAGRSSGRHGFAPSGQMKHGLDPQMEAAEHIADQFAHQLAQYLRGGRTHQEFENLILIAEPGFLGKIRSFLDKETAKCVVGTHNRNWNSIPEHELFDHLDQLVMDHRKIA